MRCGRTSPRPGKPRSAPPRISRRPAPRCSPGQRPISRPRGRTSRGPRTRSTGRCSTCGRCAGRTLAEVYVVAITELATPVEQEAAALAADLGTTPYEERLNLASGLPAVVLTAADRARALALLKALRARGHGAVAIDAAVVVSSEAMVSMRRFGLEEGALTAEGERLPHGEILALIRAMHRTRTETRA